MSISISMMMNDEYEYDDEYELYEYELYELYEYDEYEYVYDDE